MSIGTGIKGTLSLGKGLGKTIDDAYKKYVKGGGKKTKKVFSAEELSKKKQLEKAKQNRQIKQQKSKKTEVVKKGKKVYDKPIGPQPKPKSVKVYDKPIGPQPKPKNVSSKQNQINKAKQNRQNRQKKTVAKGKTVYNKPAGPFPKVYKKPAGPTPKPTSFLKRNKGKIAAGTALLSTVPFLINTDDSKIGAKENKKVTPSKDIGPDTSKITKPTTAKVKKQTLPQTKADDYTGRFIDKKGNVAYDSFSDFLAHMTGKPKKRAMPKKTARIIGTGNKLKRKEADTKGAGKGVKFKAFKAGTKDKTISQKQLDKNAKYKASKAYQLKNMEKVGLMDIIKNPIKAIKKSSSNVTTARRRAKQVAAGDPIAERKYGTGKRTGDKMSYMYPEGVLKFKPDGSVEKPLKSYKRNPKSKNRSGFEVTNKSGGGLIAGLYDKPEKVETYKGNTSSARQVKGYGKARKRP